MQADRRDRFVLTAPSRVGQSWRWALLAAAVVMQAFALYLPAVPGPSLQLPMDKLVHFLLFAVVAFLARWAGVPLWLTAALLLTQAVASELVQGFLLSERGAEWADFAADLLGIVAGLVAGSWLRARERTGPGG